MGQAGGARSLYMASASGGLFENGPMSSGDQGRWSIKSIPQLSSPPSAPLVPNAEVVICSAGIPRAALEDIGLAGHTLLMPMHHHCVKG